MKREGPAAGSSPSKRLRQSLSGAGASSFTTLSAPFKLAKTTLSFCHAKDVRTPDARRTLGQVLRAPREYDGTGGKSTLSSGVLEGLGEKRLALAFQRPFGGVNPLDALRKAKEYKSEHGQPESGEDGCAAGSEPRQDEDPVPRETEKRIRSDFANFPILRWALMWRDIFLNEVIRLDGRADALGLARCPGCDKEGFPEYRCKDCQGANLCAACMKHWHRYNPLHNIERYNGSFYEKIREADLGVRIQLMHPPGESCSFRAVHQIKDFTIIHTNGIHQVPVDFCGCDKGADIPYHIQLLRSRLWPATCVNPQTATTHEALDQFTRISLLGRLNVYDYYRSLRTATDGARLCEIADVRKQLTTCVRQFRHVLMFKRAGRGHEPGGIAATPLGACAIRCPACPNFDLNVPLDWALSPFRWLYRVILSLDANFRLNNKLTDSKDRTDPNLTDGCAYMAPRLQYDAYILKTEGAPEPEPPCDCSRFGALVMANIKGGKGMRTTGVGGCFCSRHEFVQPLGLATLKKGERYSTMDWVFCGALSFLRCAEITVCYDIACQWSKRLYGRMNKIAPDCLIFSGATEFLKHHVGGTITYVVPKFHLYAHKVFCQLRYALGLLFGTGETDGEGCERVWSGANPAASSLREMGPGGMSDTMDDMCNSWNWRKTCGLANLLCERMVRALSNGAEQTAIFTEFTAAIEADDPAKVAQARAAIRTWEQDPVKKERTPCPYYIEKQELSVAQIKRQADQAQGLSPAAVDAMPDVEKAATLTDFMLLGFKIEEDRASFPLKHKTTGGTTKQASDRSNALNRILASIRAFRKGQEHYMEDVYAALTWDERYPARDTALTVPLYLPSNPPGQDESLVSPTTRTMEVKVRWAEMADELSGLRDQLRLKGCLNKFKLANITGQRSNTRAREAQDIVIRNVVARGA
ncbi:unnamed protein product [Peniophora sp. CBMAI 1063]|nr:unnamed protein product [Peniophora sp. CBMAI 1063]